LAYQVETVNIFDENVYIGAPLGRPDVPFVVLDWHPDGSRGTNWPQNNLMVDTDETTKIVIYSTVENGDNTNAITQEVRYRLFEAQKEMEIALNLWLYNKVPIEIDPIDDPGVFTDWSKKIYFWEAAAKHLLIDFSPNSTTSTAVQFSIELKYNDNNE
jgi:hypothetical protein